MTMDRRRVLTAAGFSAAAATALPQLVAASAPTSVQPQRPLSNSYMRVVAIQSVATADRQQNLSKMLRDIERTAAESPSLIAFSAVALQGPRPTHIDATRAMSVELDGPETDALAAAARRFGVYIAFGALTTDADWPGHVIPRNMLISPDGRLVAATWQASADSSTPFLTSIDAVLDRFNALYGADASLPVIGTDIGNIALSSDLAAPEIYRALALKGAEIIVRLAPQTNPIWDVQATAAYNKCFIVAPMAAADLHASNDERDHHQSGGGSLIVGPSGEVLAGAASQWSQTLSASLAVEHARLSRGALNTHANLVLPTLAAQA